MCSCCHWSAGWWHSWGLYVCDSVDELALTHSNFHNLDYQDCRQTIITNISNTMTDRVAVNHAAIERIKQRWGTDLNELNCHLHPLTQLWVPVVLRWKRWRQSAAVCLDKTVWWAMLFCKWTKWDTKMGRVIQKDLSSFLMITICHEASCHATVVTDSMFCSTSAGNWCSITPSSWSSCHLVQFHVVDCDQVFNMTLSTKYCSSTGDAGPWSVWQTSVCPMDEEILHISSRPNWSHRWNWSC